MGPGDQSASLLDSSRPRALQAVGPRVHFFLCSGFLIQCVCMLMAQSYPTLQPHGLQATKFLSMKEYLNGLPFPSPGESSRPRDGTGVS